MKCPDCNEEIVAGSSFCGNCGKPLDEEEKAEASNSVHRAETVVITPTLFRLVVLNGLEKDKVVVLDRDEISLGRETDNAFVLLDPLVSRHHAVFRRRGDIYEVEDLDSANGVYINGLRISGLQALNEGDKVKLGNTEILFTQTPLDMENLEGVEKTISMRDETPQKPQPMPSRAQQVPPPPPPPPVSSVRVQPKDNEITAPHPIPVPPTVRKRGGTTNWVMLSCAIIVLLALTLACLIFVALPQFAAVR